MCMALNVVFMKTRKNISEKFEIIELKLYI